MRAHDLSSVHQHSGARSSSKLAAARSIASPARWPGLRRQRTSRDRVVDNGSSSSSRMRGTPCASGKANGSKAPWGRPRPVSAASGSFPQPAARPEDAGDAARRSQEQQPRSQIHKRAAPWSWAPRLSAGDVALMLLVAALPCVLLWLVAAPARFSPSFAAGMAAVYAVLCAAARGVLLERQHQVRMGRSGPGSAMTDVQ